MKKVKINDISKFKFLGSLKFSPDGNHISYSYKKPNMNKNSYDSSLCVLKNNKNMLKLTTSGKDGVYDWLDNDTIIFSSKRDSDKDNPFEYKSNFYKISINGGEALKAFDIDRLITNINVINKDLYILNAIYDPNVELFKEMSEEEKKEQLNYEVLDEIPFWSNGSGFTNKKRSQILLYDVKKDKYTVLTDKFSNNYNLSLNKDKTKMLYLSNSYKDKMKPYSDLYELDIKSRKITKITPFDKFIYHNAIYLNNKIVFTGHFGKDYGINENPEMFIYDYKNANMIASPDTGLRNSVGTDVALGLYESISSSDNYIYFIAMNRYKSEIRRIDEKGETITIFNSNGSINGLALFNDKVAFIGMQNMNLQEVYLFDKEVTKLSSHNEEYAKTHSIQKLNRIDYERAGYQMSGWVIKPLGYEKGKKYPAILDIHGGPKTVYGEVFYHEMQVWANRGYFVVFTNPRGSDGYGNDYMDIRGKYGTIDYDDLMDFLDRAIEAYPDIDSSNLAVTGGSYGGFMTNWIIGHTDRFKVAASQRSIANWLSKFGTTDIGYYFVPDQNIHTPWTDPEALWWHSPMKYADKAKTPTLFIHSEQDLRCWVTEGYQMFTSLKFNGVDSKLVLFRDETHELSRSGRPKGRIRRLKEITDWFDKYID